MDSHSQPHSPEASDALTTTLPSDTVNLRFAPEFVGATGIVEGLLRLVIGKSDREIWLIAREAQAEQPQQIFGRFIVARVISEGRVCWRYCDIQHDPFGDNSYPLILEQHPQELHYACAQLAADLFQLAQQHQANVFRLDSSAAGTVNVPPLPWPPRRWHRIDTHGLTRTSVTHESLRELLCREQGLTPEAADRQLEAHACNSGLIRIGEDCYRSEPWRLMPPIPDGDYERLIRALERHRKDCENDRLAHAQRNNYGAARAFASEEAATLKTVELITSLTQKFP